MHRLLKWSTELTETRKKMNLLMYLHYLMGLGPNSQKIPQNSEKQIRIPLTEKRRISGASRSEKMFEHISIISNNFCTFVWALHKVNIQDCRL